MEKGSIPVYLITIMVVMLILIGEIIVFTSSQDDFSSDVTIEDDTLTYSLEGKGSYTYDVVSLNGSLGSPSEVFVYYDPGYGSMVNQVSVSTGAMALDQGYYVEQMSPTLKVRGITNVKIVDAEELGTIMANPGYGKAVVILSGAIPDTVYDGMSESVILDWIETGGRLYWAGNVIGQYIAHKGSVEEVECGQSIFLGAECINTEDTRGEEVIDNGFRDVLYLQNNLLRFAPDLSLLPEDSVCVVMGYTDGSCNSITSLSVGKGSVCIFGGDYSSRQRIDLAQVIASGVGPETELVEYATGVMNHSINGTIGKADAVYVVLGGFFPVYCRLHEVVE